MSANCDTFGGMIIPAVATSTSTTACTVTARSTLTHAWNGAEFEVFAGQLTLMMNTLPDLLKSIDGNCLSSILLGSSSSVIYSKNAASRFAMVVKVRGIDCEGTHV